ncbi:hypothetical protein SAMN05660413_03110 [Salegentibacter flavus]|uniref:Uncharacterized protein n=1 Tax=Salegentibacter flavus TaxID=287099 RepID=A0A1I5D0N7_9FLAO|nr:hypothetical protein SAMN05660413_03110 [Salegentibacter flavus]
MGSYSDAFLLELKSVCLISERLNLSLMPILYGFKIPSLLHNKAEIPQRIKNKNSRQVSSPEREFLF